MLHIFFLKKYNNNESNFVTNNNFQIQRIVYECKMYTRYSTSYLINNRTLFKKIKLNHFKKYYVIIEIIEV